MMSGRSSLSFQVHLSQPLPARIVHSAARASCLSQLALTGSLTYVQYDLARSASPIDSSSSLAGSTSALGLSPSTVAWACCT
jgi:hypothetical protein